MVTRFTVMRHFLVCLLILPIFKVSYYWVVYICRITNHAAYYYDLDILCAGAAARLSTLHITPPEQPSFSGLRGLWTT